jgi:DNA-binding LacI/PurR family transcriptional regulator
MHRLANGTGKEDAARVTVVDVARRAGVSPTTVSRVLLRRGVVTPTTRDRVLKVVAALGYRPNALAQGLRMGRGRSVALLVGDIEQSVYSALTKHVQAALESIGLELLLFNLGHREDRLHALLERAAALRLRGVCIASSDVIPVRTLKPLLRDLAAKGIQVIAIGQRLDRHGIASVVHDDALGATQAVRHLLQQGRAPVAYLGRIRSSAAGSERYRGFRASLEQAGMTLDSRLVWETSQRYRYEAGYAEMSAALDRGLSVRSVFAASDELALGAMAAALDRKLRVPHDIAFIGVGGISWGAHVRPALTTVAGDPAAVGERIRAIFTESDEGRVVPLRSNIKMNLIMRESA